MARFAFVSGFACALSWWLRLLDEGHEVRVWIEPKTHKTVGDGMVDKAGTFDELMLWALDGARRMPTVMVFDSSGTGDLADTARKRGLYVMGGGGFMDKLEKDRSFGFDIAREAGAQLPPYVEFKSLDETIAHAQSGAIGSEVYWKTDRYLDADATHGAEDGEELAEYLEEIRERHGAKMSNIVQEKIDGVAISTARWWDGRAWCTPYEGVIEHKKFLVGDLGPATGCSLNAVWWYEADYPQIARSLNWEALTTRFLKEQAPPGIYDMNAIIDEQGDAWFLEWTPRFGYDSEMTIPMLIGDLGLFIWTVATGQGEPDLSVGPLAYTVRLSVPPYPWEHSVPSDRKTATGLRIRGDLERFIPYLVRLGEGGPELAAPEALLGLVGAAGTELSALHDDCMEAAEGMKKTAGLQYRNDGEEVICEDAEKMKKAGIDDLPPGLCD